MTRTPDATAFEHLLSQRLTRRRVLAAGATLAPLAVAGSGLLGACTSLRPTSALSFKPIQGSQADTVLAWDPTNQTLIAANIVGTMPWTVDH